MPDESFYNDKDETRFFTKEYKDTVNKIRQYQKEKFVKDETYKKCISHIQDSVQTSRSVKIN